MPQSIDEQIRIFPTIEPELHLGKVGRKMLGADLMPTTDNAALQQTKCGFHRVSRDANAVLVSSIFLGVVVDRFMFQIADSMGIGWQLVGYDHVNVLADVFADIFCESSFSRILSMEESHISPTLPNADHDFLVISSALEFAAFFLPSDVGFVHFDSTVKHRAVCLFHGGANPMAEIPRGFVANSDHALDLIGAHSLASFAEEQYSHEPRFQRQVGIVEDRLREDAELIPAFDTLEFLLRGNLESSLAFATDAFNAERPAELFEQCAALFVGREHLSEVGDSYDE